ncbi:hypothetical protein [Saccharicrinis aurantiacus]|uniref:hypothetical protein n=1 Tax=Saccharicrinis aurantiacus TaxID=1849719 RepID=UPI00094FF265|nr:hypothetical protein [Saccharicrinis aurantiacus]
MNSNKMLLKAAIAALVFVFYINANAQDVEQIGKGPLLIGNGGVSFSQIGQVSPDSISSITPYSYYLSGNLNLNILNTVSLPISFAYTNNQTSANLANPFNRFSLSPSYKWIQAHMGYSSMSFSPYTLSGHEFYGGGIELQPDDHFRFSAMYGRLRKAVEVDSINVQPVYKRMGGAFLFGYTNDKFDITFNLLKARDEMNSLSFTPRDSTYITPEENLAGSIALKVNLTNNLLLDAEYGLSGVNRDISTRDSIAGNSLLTGGGDLAVYHALRGSVSQSSSVGQIGATYERIAPNYNTFGAYYYTNDFENITLDLSSSILTWLKWSINAGYQRDNLENQKTDTNNRVILSANTMSPITKKLVLNLNYSNVQSYVHIKDIYNQISETNDFQNLDTLSFTQLNMSTGVNISYALKADKRQRQNVNCGFSYQEAAEQQNNDGRYVGNQIFNTMIAYQYSLIPIRLNISSSINHNQNKLPDSRMDVISYSLSVQKTFWESFKTAFISTYSKSYNQDIKLSDVVNLRLNTGYKVKKRHSLNLSLAMVSNKSISRESMMYSANLNYNYIFDFKADRKGKKSSFEGNF